VRRSRATSVGILANDLELVVVFRASFFKRSLDARFPEECLTPLPLRSPYFDPARSCACPFTPRQRTPEPVVAGGPFPYGPHPQETPSYVATPNFCRRHDGVSPLHRWREIRRGQAMPAPGARISLVRLFRTHRHAPTRRSDRAGLSCRHLAHLIGRLGNQLAPSTGLATLGSGVGGFRYFSNHATSHSIFALRCV